MGHRLPGGLIPFGPSEAQRSVVVRVRKDRGCPYGGPSCLRCGLPQCVEDLSAEQFRQFVLSWEAAQNRSRLALDKRR